MNEHHPSQPFDRELNYWLTKWHWLDQWEQDEERNIENNIAETSKLRWRHKQETGFHTIGESLSRMFRQQLLTHISGSGQITELKQYVRDKILDLQQKQDKE